jgi:hypothetical protein
VAHCAIPLLATQFRVSEQIQIANGSTEGAEDIRENVSHCWIAELCLFAKLANIHLAQQALFGGKEAVGY